MTPKVQKIVIPLLFVLVVAAIVIGMKALTSNAGVTTNPGVVSGQSGKHHKVAIIKMPAPTTTTETPATVVAPAAVPPASPRITQSTPTPVHSVTPITATPVAPPKAITVTVPSAPTTTVPPRLPIDDTSTTLATIAVTTSS